MELDPELAQKWIDSADRLEASLARLRMPDRRHGLDGLPGVSTQAGNIVVRIEDGKTPRLVTLAVFSAALCAVLSIITLIGGGMLYLNMKDHLDAIYMMAPQLKPENLHVDHHLDPAAQEDHQHQHG